MDEDIGASNVSENAWTAFKPYKGFSESKTRISDPIFDNESETSEISEFTQAQEVELRRKRKRPGSEPLSGSMELEDGKASFLDSWTPGFDIHPKNEEHGKKVSWPRQSQLESTLKTTIASEDSMDLRNSLDVTKRLDDSRRLGDRPRSFADSMEIIPEDVRKQTPRATAFGNKVMMMTPGAEGVKSHDLSHLQGATNKIESGTTRGYIQQLSRERDFIAEEPSEDRSPTVDAEHTTPKMPLDQTMRYEFRQLSQEDTRRPIENVMEDIGEQIRQKQEEEDIEDKKITPCWWRSIAFVFVVGLLVAAIITFSVMYRTEEKPKHATVSIIEDPVIKKECMDTTLKLGDTIRFECDFVVGHAAAGTINTTTRIKVTPPNKVNSDSFSSTRKANESKWNVTGPETTCTSRGRYILGFLDLQNNMLFSSIVYVKIEAGHVTSSLEQMDADQTNPRFMATCSIDNDCRNEDLLFRGSRHNQTVTLDEEKECNSSFSDRLGYTTRCSTRFHGNKTNFTSLYPVCQTQPGNKNQPIQLPSCRPIRDCSHTCTSYQGNNCSDVQSCFSPDLKIYNYNSSTCALGWCHHNDTVMTSLTVSEALCLTDLTTPITHGVNQTTPNP